MITAAALNHHPHYIRDSSDWGLEGNTGKRLLKSKTKNEYTKWSFRKRYRRYVCNISAIFSQAQIVAKPKYHHAVPAFDNWLFDGLCSKIEWKITWFHFHSFYIWWLWMIDSFPRQFVTKTVHSWTGQLHDFRISEFHPRFCHNLDRESPVYSCKPIISPSSPSAVITVSAESLST